MPLTQFCKIHEAAAMAGIQLELPTAQNLTQDNLGKTHKHIPTPTPTKTTRAALKTQDLML